MKLPSQRRLFKQDFDQQYQNLVDGLASTINTNFEVLFQTLANNVDIENNIFGNVTTFQVVVDSRGVPTSTTTLALTTPLTNTATGVLVINITNTTNSTALLTGGVTILYSKNQNGIVINQITGLIAGNTYQIVVLVLG